MYMNHFGFTHVPFERGIDTSLLYESDQFKEALARLLYTCQNRTLAVITGDSGAGKSTLLRMLSSRLDRDNYAFVYIADSYLTPRNFYTLALSNLGCDSPAQLPKLKRNFQEILLNLYETKGKTCVIVIDEAQTLEISMLQELRFVMNFKVDSFSPMAVILSGQPEFKSTLRTLHLAAIWRRVDTTYHIGGMNIDEMKAYITHQLKSAGCSRPLFPDDVLGRIYERSKGIAASINTICRGCLLDAASRGQELVGAENLSRVLNEIS